MLATADKPRSEKKAQEAMKRVESSSSSWKGEGSQSWRKRRGLDSRHWSRRQRKAAVCSATTSSVDCSSGEGKRCQPRARGMRQVRGTRTPLHGGVGGREGETPAVFQTYASTDARTQACSIGTNYARLALGEYTTLHRLTPSALRR